MIYYLVSQRFANTIGKFLRGAGDKLDKTIRYFTYEELFFERRAPIGHFIFTDFDRLNAYELAKAAAFAKAVSERAPDVKLFNHPLRALERTALLVALNRAGINNFTATRLDTGDVPASYPVFIRSEDGCAGPETEPLASEAEFRVALADFSARGIPLKGRVAIGLAAEKMADGFYRKFGAFNIGGTIIPQHLMRSDTWIVKKSVFDGNAVQKFGRDVSDAAAAEEADFVKENPHRDILLKAFNIGRIDFGRVDYGIVNGKVQVYEINTNPTFPRFGENDNRAERRAFINGKIVDAFRSLDTPISTRGSIGFKDVRPRASPVHLPRSRLPASLGRMLKRRLPIIGE
jgi:hypothetical protein